MWARMLLFNLLLLFFSFSFRYHDGLECVGSAQHSNGRYFPMGRYDEHRQWEIHLQWYSPINFNGPLNIWFNSTNVESYLLLKLSRSRDLDPVTLCHRDSVTYPGTNFQLMNITNFLGACHTPLTSPSSRLSPGSPALHPH